MPQLKIDLPYKSYSIHIKKGIINDLGDLIGEFYNKDRIIVLTDLNVNALYREKVENSLKKCGFESNFVVVEGGEKSKSLETLKEVYDEFLNLKANRDDLILTLGGGVIGDLGGFAASTYLRGIPFVNVPTSLLAQLDSSIGGKVAVNLPRGKNLVGSFYHPEAVFIDPLLLKTLDKRFLHDGMTEAIKYGCIKDEDLFYKLLNREDTFENIESIIYSCLSIKKELVELDERDNSSRRLLNFGHTIGHAIEKYFNYEVYTHGEAVAIGMYHITRRSEELGLTRMGTANLIKEILEKYELDIKTPNIDIDSIIDTIKLDKKSSGNNINIVLLKSIGESFIKSVNFEDIKMYL